MDLMVLQVLLVCGFLAFQGLIFAGALWNTARRAANGDDVLIRRLPPTSQPMAVRAAHLRMQVRQEVIKFVKIDAVIAGAIVVLGVFVAVSDQAPIGAGIAVTAILSGVIVVLFALMNGLHVLARYLGAQRRLRNDVVRHGSGGQPPAISNGTY
jgi:hypothetical protein